MPFVKYSTLVFMIRILLFLSLLMNGSNCFAKAKQTITIRLEHRLNQLPLSGNRSTVNTFNDSLTVYKWQYYLSGFFVTDSISGKQITIAKTPVLINAFDTSVIILEVPKGRYSKIGFTVGVDSIYNVTGVQTGDLDPAKAMFWTWQTGYIHVKVEGNSPQSKAPFKKFTYHIGGYKHPFNTNRRITLDYTNNNRPVNINVDLQPLFNVISVKDNAGIMSPNQAAINMADALPLMFSL